MYTQRTNPSSPRFQKILLPVILAGLFLFGIGAEQPAEGDCCQGPTCGFSLYPDRIEKLEFGKSTTVSVRFTCNGEIHPASIRVARGWGLDAELSGEILTITAKELSSIRDYEKERIVQNYIIHRMAPGALMIDDLGIHTEAQVNLDQIIALTATAVILNAEYSDDYGITRKMRGIIPVNLDFDAVMDELIKDPEKAD